jgi:hypothetical protein
MPIPGIVKQIEAYDNSLSQEGRNQKWHTRVKLRFSINQRFELSATLAHLPPRVMPQSQKSSLYAAVFRLVDLDCTRFAVAYCGPDIE